jgi:ammonia channel protein AmtB
MQLAGMCAIIGWTCVMSFIYFLPFKLLGAIRVSDSVELMGFDIAEMGGLTKKQMNKIRLEVM